MPLSNEELLGQKLVVNYVDEETQKPEKIEIKLAAETIIPDLNKYSVKVEMDNL